jgi:hypothetical protein
MADLPLATGVFTTTLTNSSLTITSSLNLRAVSVYNTSSVAGSVQGNQSVPSLTAAQISIGENESFNVAGLENNVLDQIQIEAPAGCTLNIIGLT